MRWALLKTNKRLYQQRKGYAKLKATLLMLAAIILYEALYWFIENYHKHSVNKHGMAVKAVIFNKTLEFKGKTIYFKYFYNGTEYNDHAHDNRLYDILNYGQTVNLLIDSLHPAENYLLEN